MDAETVDKCALNALQFKVNMDTCKVSTAINVLRAQETRFKEFQLLSYVLNITLRLSWSVMSEL